MLVYRWMSLGNQLNGVRLVDEGLRARYKAAYPDQVIQPPDPPTRTGGQDSKASVHGNDSASTQTKSSPASTHKVEIVTAAPTVTVSSTVVTSVDEKAPAPQENEMLLD